MVFEGVSGHTLVGYRHEVTIEIGGHRFASPIAFTSEMPDNAVNILGHGHPDLVHAIQNSHWRGPGLVPFGFSSSSHLGLLGVQIDKTNADGSQTTMGPVYTTDDTSSGAITQYTGTPATPPSNGIPSD